MMNLLAPSLTSAGAGRLFKPRSRHNVGAPSVGGFSEYKGKRAFDVLAAILGLALSGPFILLIAFAVRLTSPGGAFFRQERIGRGGLPFQILKFRTMHAHMCDRTGVAQTVENDSRVTTIGRMLRRTNLDEIPQLINVLKGDMSLVGPRPHVPGMLAVGVPYESLCPQYEDRHRVRPGLTGLAQANGFRGPTTDPFAAVRRVELDLEYVATASIWIDAKIIAKTFVTELSGGSGF